MMAHSDDIRRILNRMGYYAYQNGLIINHLKQEGGWDSHLAHCRDFILKAVRLNAPRTVTVLGSGWLLDLPLAEMLESTERIYLVDIIHPPEVIKQAGTLDKVKLIEEDITGGLIRQLWDKAGRLPFFGKIKEVESIMIPDYEPGFDPGLIISLNILTQLEAQLLLFLRKKSTLSEEMLLPFRKGIQEKHIAFLRKYKSVLITDTAEVVTRNTGETEIIPTLFAGIPSGDLKEEWTWDYDLKGRDFYNSRSVMKEVAVIF